MENTDDLAQNSLKSCSEIDMWITPEMVLSKNSDCHIVGNKLHSFMLDESHKAKWEEFRKLAKSDTANEECSQLLRRMELQDSDEEEESLTDDFFLPMKESDTATDKLEMEMDRFEETLDKKKPKRQKNWGPTLRMPRTRRFMEDGKTVLQRAMELKEYKNLQGNKPNLASASESNKKFIDMSSCVNISLGTSEKMIIDNLDLIKSKDLKTRSDFLEKNPEINLPSDLNLDMSLEDFPCLNEGVERDNITLLREDDVSLENSWVKIASKGLKPADTSNVSNDRCNLEC